MIYLNNSTKYLSMNKFIITLLLSFTLVSCANVKEKMPTLKECDGTETNKTLAEILCKKK